MVTRFDPENHEIVATIETPGTDDFARLAVGYGSVWVTANHGMVYRIDPATNKVIASTDVGDYAFGIAVGGGSVWITSPGEVGELIRLDAVTNQVVGDPIEVGPGPVPVAFDFGYAWVSNTSPPSLVRVDPNSGGVETIGPGGKLLIANGSLWAAADDEVVRIDPESGHTLAHIPLPRAGILAAGDEAIWVLAWPDTASSPSALWMIDPATNQIVGEAVAVDSPQPIAIAVTDGVVWVADYTQMILSRFDLIP
jgi:streptogramin lyase